jgi:hypothetical protein
MRNVVNNSSTGFKRTQNVYPSCMVSLHTVAIAITMHTTGWSKRVLAVPPGTSERPAKHF